MIEINLIAKKKKAHIPVILGIDINKINFIALGLSLTLLYLPAWILVPDWEEEKQEVDDTLADLNARLLKVNREIQASADVQDQLDAFNQQIERLEARSLQVQEIIDRRTNPKRVLETIARSTPEQMWFNELRIEEANQLVIKGGAQNYRSIGDFITAANGSPFFGSSLVLESSSTEEEEVANTTMRVEKFEIKGNIVTYDPF